MLRYCRRRRPRATRARIPTTRPWPKRRRTRGCLFTPAYVLPVLILPLVLMLLREPLSHLLAKDPHWREFSVGEVLGTGFFELFETLLSYLTNTLSFMRVGAYAITHVGLMLVVHMLAGLAGGVGGPAGILILVLGNAFATPGLTIDTHFGRLARIMVSSGAPSSLSLAQS